MILQGENRQELWSTVSTITAIREAFGAPYPGGCTEGLGLDAHKSGYPLCELL